MVNMEIIVIREIIRVIFFMGAHLVSKIVFGDT
jgi:hypothetical protein